jgi:hypothetical protein
VKSALIAFSLVLLLSGCSNGSGVATDSGGDVPDDIPCTTSTVLAAPVPPESPLFTLDPLGKATDVTCKWQHYQPAAQFCVPLDGIEYAPGGTGPLTDGSDPACAFSGFSPSDSGLYKFDFAVPTLCPGCRRLFIDFATIPADDAAKLLYYAHGHAYYRVSSANPSYSIEPTSHSPNTKDFFNDKLVSPPGSPVEALVRVADTYDMAYVTDVVHFIHTAIQGVHYIGPWYVNREGERIHGIYLDVDAGSATAFGVPSFDAFFYQAGYNSGQDTCFNSDGTPMVNDADLLYGGCVDRIGGSSDAFDPFAP